MKRKIKQSRLTLESPMLSVIRAENVILADMS